MADHKLVFAMLDGLGVLDPLTGKILDRWNPTFKQRELYTLCPSLRRHILVFDGGAYLGTQPLNVQSAPWGPPTTVYAWGSRLLALYDYEDYSMDLGPMSGQRGTARLA